MIPALAPHNGIPCSLTTILHGMFSFLNPVFRHICMLNVYKWYSI